jgi:sec-independent protein translocase protein TatA
MFEGLFQPMHLLVILIIAMLVFGPKRIPELGKALGEGIKGFKDGVKDQSQANTNTTVQNTTAQNTNSSAETKS